MEHHLAAHLCRGFLCLKDEPTKADLIFILGGSSLAPVHKAAELYHNGFAPRICFVSKGGRFGGEDLWGMSEVSKYRLVLKNLGIPEEAILAEDQSERQTCNTLAEAKYAGEFWGSSEPHRVQRVILVSRPVHQRRAWATFKRHNPSVNFINCPADEFLDVENKEELIRLVQEVQRLLDYGVKRTDLERQEIPRQILIAAASLRLGLRLKRESDR